MYIEILTAATATNSPPSGATAGKAISGPTATAEAYHQPADASVDEAVVLVRSTAGSAIMTVTVRLWGWCPITSEWYPLGPGTAAAPDTTRGVLNGGSAIGEITADKLQHSELINGLRHFTRAYAEITAIGGTATAVSVSLKA